MATTTNKLLLLSLILGTTLLLLGTASARSDIGTSRADFNFDSSNATINCTNVTCDKLIDVIWSWYVLNGGTSTNNAQLSSINFNTSGYINIASGIACQDVLNGIPPPEYSFLERESKTTQKRSRSRRPTTPVRPTTPATVDDENAATTEDIQPLKSEPAGLIQNKVKQNRKLRHKKQQTAYSAIYSSFLDIDIDFDTDFDFDTDTDTDTDFEAESQSQSQTHTNTGTRNSRSRSSFSSKFKRAAAGGVKYYPSYNVTSQDLIDLYTFQLCYVNNWADYYVYDGTNYNSYYDSVYFCNNDINPWFNYPAVYFPNNYGIDNSTYRAMYLDDLSDLLYNAYDFMNCTFWD